MTLRNLLKFVIVGLLTGIILIVTTTKLQAEVTRLTVDARLVPVLGVDSSAPEFGWELSTSNFFDARQTSYSIIVTSSRSNLEAGVVDCWQSGVVNSDKTYGIKYAGTPLRSSTRYFWQVTVSWKGVDVQGEAVEKEEKAVGEFVTGVLNPEEWEASWITAERKDSDPLPTLFCSFNLEQSGENVQDAFLHICGLGQQIVSINSRRVGNRTSIDPGWTNYRKTCLYTTFDVKEELLSSDNCSISVLLGNGMYNVSGGRYVKFTGSFGLPKVIARLVIRYKDGALQTVVTDERWKTLPSPLVFSCVYGGDNVDFSRGVLSQSRILTYGKPSSAVKTDGPGGVLRAQTQPPVVVLETLKPIAVRTLGDGRIEANFGYNFAGRPVVQCVPAADTSFRIFLAEMENKPWEGHFDEYVFNRPHTTQDKEEVVLEYAVAPSFNSSSNHLLQVTPEEKLSSTFGYWGFQYVYFDGAVEFQPDLAKALESKSTKTQVIAIEADRIGANLEKVGSFESDGAWLNEIDLMIDRSVRSNIVSLMTDCPHREKLGWLEETHLMGPSILYRYNLRTLFRKICRDMTEAQLDDGMIPDIAPEYTRFVQGFFWSAEWSSAAVQLPWLLYRWYGDLQIVSEQYDTMDRYVRYMATVRDDKGLVKAGLGDWYDWSPEKRHVGYSQHTPRELTATAFLCDNARIMTLFARLLGKDDDIKYYEELCRQAKNDFQREYFDPATNVIATGSQASYAFALYFDLVPKEARDAVFLHLLEEIEKWNYRMSCGEVAWPFLIRTLSDFGRNDVLWKMIQRDDAPGYVHMLKKWGMKTLSETWDGPGSSMNHFMFGAIQEWFMSGVVGIQQVEDSIGYSKALLRPSPMPNEINHARGEYRSNWGWIVSDWQVNPDSGLFVWNVVVPTGTTAQLEIPVVDASTPVVIEKTSDEIDVKLGSFKSEYHPAQYNGFSRRCVTLESGAYRIVSHL